MPRFAIVALVSALLPTTIAGATSVGYGDTFADRTLLPEGTTTITGHLQGECQSDDPQACATVLDWTDWFAFVGLIPGSPWSLTATESLSDAGTWFEAYDSTGHKLGAGCADNEGSSYCPVTQWVFGGVAPADGQLVIGVEVGQDFSTYRVDLTATHAPEPTTTLLLGGGLVGLAMAGRRPLTS